jgi:hypothetical protein
VYFQNTFRFIQVIFNKYFIYYFPFQRWTDSALYKPNNTIMPILMDGTIEFLHTEQVSALFTFRLGQVYCTKSYRPAGWMQRDLLREHAPQFKARVMSIQGRIIIITKNTCKSYYFAYFILLFNSGIFHAPVEGGGQFSGCPLPDGVHW